MLVLLPPSETKRDGGAGPALDLGSLSFGSLAPQRRATLAALKRVSRSVSASHAALGLGPTQRAEIDRNRTISTSPTMPAIERYTGVLFDALDVATLDPAPRAWLDAHVAVHSALFGPVGAGDLVPAYRLSHDSRLPNLPLKRHWALAVSRALEEHDGLVLDFRSEAYVHLGPAPRSVFLRVVTVGESGQKRALNHFNKKGKGEFLRALALAGAEHANVESLIDWAVSQGILLALNERGELELTV